MVHSVGDMERDTTSPSSGQLRTVAQVAALAGITVRTLHHYDQLGLLTPTARSDAEYRLYGAADIARLREILVWRRLGMPLAEIGRLLDDPTVDRRAVLEQQRALVADRIDELRELAAALDRALETAGGDVQLTKGNPVARDQEIIEALGGFDPADHADEARERWGDTDAYRQSAARTRQYGPEQWRAITAEAAAIQKQLAALWQAGADPSGPDALAGAEAWRLHISRWYYDCPPEFLRGLGELYVTDPRFRVTYDGADGARAGLADWVRDAWVARADAG